MHQDQLFPMHTEVILVSATWDDIQGWHVSTTSRAQGDTWTPHEWVHYDSLTAAELVDVVSAELYKRA